MRAVRGGAASYTADRLRGQIQEYDEPGFEGYGFRVAPEAHSDALLTAGLLALFGLTGWRRAQRRWGDSPGFLTMRESSFSSGGKPLLRPGMTLTLS
jgi:hypothetical protein